jgi:hypothetical protein
MDMGIKDSNDEPCRAVALEGFTPGHRGHPLWLRGVCAACFPRVVSILQGFGPMDYQAFTNDSLTMM